MRPISRRRRTQGSISTASSSISPRKAGTAPGGSWAIPWTAISLPPITIVRVAGMPSRSSLSISTIRSAPSAEPTIRPRPPRMLVPPTITEAITISSAPKPAWLSVPLACATESRPAITAVSAEITKARMRTRSVLMPRRLAAARLPPVA